MDGNAINFRNNLLGFIEKVYPKNILGLDANINQSREIKNLENLCEQGITQFEKTWNNFIKESSNSFMGKVEILEKTSYFINEPSFVMQVSDYECNIHYNLYKSFLIPYFYVRKLNLKNNKPKTIELNPLKIFDLEINFFEKKLECSIFPEEFLEDVVPNISYEEIDFNNFKMQNAFFNKTESII